MNSTTKKMTPVCVTMVFALAMLFAFPVSASAGFDKPVDEEKEEITFRFADEELLNFFDANRDLSEINRETQEKMAQAAEAQNLTLERFNQIANANRIGALQGGAFTDDEVQAFIDLGPQISQIQREQQQLIQAKLEEKGFTAQKYQEILAEYRTDQNLQSHVRDLLRERRRQEILEERRREAEEKANQEAGS